MNQEQFQSALNFVLENEGITFTNDPMDAGGPTKFGVTLKAYEQFVGHTCSAQVIQALTLVDVTAFYYHTFWKPLGCYRMKNKAIATAIFDTGVLYGPGRAGLLAQQTLNLCDASISLKLDGKLGDKSIEQLDQVNQQNFLDHFHTLVLLEIESIISNKPQNMKFAQGWTNRADRLLTLNNAVQA